MHVSRIEAGQRRVSLGDLQRITKYFGKPLSYFVDDFDGLQLDRKLAEAVNILRFSVVPVYGTVVAGEPVLVMDKGLDVITFPKSLVGRADFGVIVRGDSMSGLGIHDGDILLVRRQDTAEDGEIVIARVNGGEYAVKRVRHAAGKPPYPESANPKCPPIAADKVETCLSLVASWACSVRASRTTYEEGSAHKDGAAVRRGAHSLIAHRRDGVLSSPAAEGERAQQMMQSWVGAHESRL